MQVWAPHHRDSVFKCEALRIMQFPQQIDEGGMVLRDVTDKILAFHVHCFGGKAGGQGTVEEVVKAAETMLRVMQAEPISSVQALNSFISQAEAQGEELWQKMSLAGFLKQQAGEVAAQADKENSSATANDSLTATTTAAASAMYSGSTPVPEQQVLRPSSRQCSHGADEVVDLLPFGSKPGSPAVAPAQPLVPKKDAGSVSASERVSPHFTIDAAQDTAAVRQLMATEEVEAAGGLVPAILLADTATEDEEVLMCFAAVSEVNWMCGLVLAWCLPSALWC